VYDRIPLKVKGKGITYFLSRKRQKVGAYFTTITLPERAKLYKPHFWHQVKDDYAEIYKEKIIDECDADFLSKMQYMDISTWLVDDVLTKVDRASMHNSLEVRVPLLDHKFAELTFKIPSNLKLKGWDKKHIFKLAMQRDLTYSVINHKKQGFSVPLKMWFKSSLKDLINDKLRSQNSYISEYLNMEYVNKIIDDHNTGMRDLNTKIWAMLFLETWLENHHASKINS
jgi:asparagine synthase (glutamine-hydrolysing)